MMAVSTRPEIEAWGITVPPSDPFIGLTTIRCRNRKRDANGQMRHCGHPVGDADLSRPGTYGGQCGRCNNSTVVVVIEVVR